MKFVELDFSQSPVDSFDPVITKEDFDADPSLKSVKQGFLVTRGQNIAVQSEDGKTLGFLSDYQKSVWGPGIQAIEKDGKTPWTEIELYTTGKLVFSEIKLDPDLDRFFKGLHQAPSQDVTKGSTSDSTYIRAQNELEDESKSEPVAWILWFFLGHLGIHRFYLGQWQWGVGIAAANIILVPILFFNVYWLFFLTPILWWIVEGFLLPHNIKTSRRDQRRRVYEKHGVRDYA